MKKKKAVAAPSTPKPVRVEFILVPTDFSEASFKALRYAARMAEMFSAKVILLYVNEPVAYPDFAAFPLVMEDEKVDRAATERLRTVGEELIGRERLERVIVRHGVPHHEITEAARSLKADLIVISTHGYTGIKHALLGSTAERVVRHAPCPVLTVRDLEREII